MTDLQFKRHRRLRHTNALRKIVRETTLHVEDFITATAYVNFLN